MLENCFRRLYCSLSKFLGLRFSVIVILNSCNTSLKALRDLAGEDCQHTVTDESLCPVTGCTLGTDVCHWMFKTKVNMVQGQEDGPLS